MSDDADVATLECRGLMLLVGCRRRTSVSLPSRTSGGTRRWPGCAASRGWRAGSAHPEHSRPPRCRSGMQSSCWKRWLGSGDRMKSSARSMSQARLWAASDEVGLQDTADEELGEGFPVESESARIESDQRRTMSRRAKPVKHEGATVGDLEGFGEQLSEKQDPHALVAQRPGEGVVFLLGLLVTQHVVEQQLGDVRRASAG